MKRGTPDHPKTLDLAEALGIPLAHAVGLLECLWHWTAEYAPDGKLGRFPSKHIARGARWADDADEFVRALHEAGWLDLDPVGPSNLPGYAIHDWDDHRPDYVRKREGARKTNTARRRSAVASDAKATQRRTLSDTAPDATDNTAGATPEERRPALPDQTRPDPTNPNPLRPEWILNPPGWLAGLAELVGTETPLPTTAECLDAIGVGEPIRSRLLPRVGADEVVSACEQVIDAPGVTDHVALVIHRLIVAAGLSTKHLDESTRVALDRIMAVQRRHRG